MPKTYWTVALVTASVSLLLGSGFGASREDPPLGQPSQMQSNVDYDRKLTDPFFKSNERSYPDGTKSLIAEETDSWSTQLSVFQPLAATSTWSDSVKRGWLMRM